MFISENFMAVVSKHQKFETRIIGLTQLINLTLHKK